LRDENAELEFKVERKKQERKLKAQHKKPPPDKKPRI
jgi:hypothetical protein